MRLDARKGDHGYTIWDAKRCREIKRFVMWVDDETAQWGQVFGFVDGVPVETTVQEDRITIYLSRKLIIFNEVDLGEPELSDVVASVPRAVEQTT